MNFGHCVIEGEGLFSRLVESQAWTQLAIINCGTNIWKMTQIQFVSKSV